MSTGLDYTRLYTDYEYYVSVLRQITYRQITATDVSGEDLQHLFDAQLRWQQILNIVKTSVSPF